MKIGYRYLDQLALEENVKVVSVRNEEGVLEVPTEEVRGTLSRFPNDQLAFTKDALPIEIVLTDGRPNHLELYPSKGTLVLICNPEQFLGDRDMSIRVHKEPRAVSPQG